MVQKSNLEKLSLIGACHTEFISIENLLTSQTELDKKAYIESFRFLYEQMGGLKDGLQEV